FDCDCSSDVCSSDLPTLSSRDYRSPASGRVNTVAAEENPSTGKSDFFSENRSFFGLAGPFLVANAHPFGRGTPGSGSSDARGDAKQASEVGAKSEYFS